jgi:hypothetical protein
MAKERGPWQESRRAWERLNGWHQDSPSASPGHPDSGPAALGALADIRLIRYLLDQAELVAVRTARSHDTSWAEIATNLGVTRQSAWERWRDLDEVGAQASAAQALVEEATRDLHRRRSSTVVPNVVGLSWSIARELLRDKGLLAVGSDPDGLPLDAFGWPNATVSDQSPESGAKVPPGSSVRLWVQGGPGGSAGVREPRRPKPDPRMKREMHDMPSDEAVS